MSLIIIGKKKGEKIKADSWEKGEGEGRRYVDARRYRALQHRHELTADGGKPEAGQGLILAGQGRDG